MREHADEETGELDAYTSLGSYPLFYVVGDSDVCCPKCANDPETGTDPFGGDLITAYDINYEDPELFCDCGERIPSAYAEPEETEPQPAEDFRATADTKATAIAAVQADAAYVASAGRYEKHGCKLYAQGVREWCFALPSGGAMCFQADDLDAAFSRVASDYAEHEGCAAFFAYVRSGQ